AVRRLQVSGRNTELPKFFPARACQTIPLFLRRNSRITTPAVDICNSFRLMRAHRINLNGDALRTRAEISWSVAMIVTISTAVQLTLQTQNVEFASENKGAERRLSEP